MLYLVVYYAGFGDYEIEDNDVVAFDNKEKAIEYANSLNIKNNYDTTDTDNLYVVMPIQYNERRK